MGDHARHRHDHRRHAPGGCIERGTPITSFGFEAEFENNLDGLTTELAGRELMAGPGMHPYHCRCDSCAFDSEWVYRAQTDSSCGGEVISYPFELDESDHWRDAMDALEEAAVVSDAEPSLRAGFHVHVDRPSNRRRRQEAYWSYLRWEQVLGDLVANGRWPSVRGQNTPTTSSFHYWEAWDDEDIVSHLPGGLFNPVTIDRTYSNREVIHRLALMRGQELDRHGWLNLNTSSGQTWEFRLFNSTRSAWRMELFVRTACLMVHPEAVSDLLVIDPHPDSLLLIAEKHDPGLELLMERQQRCAKTHEPLTVLAGAPVAPAPQRRSFDLAAVAIPAVPPSQRWTAIRNRPPLTVDDLNAVLETQRQGHARTYTYSYSLAD